MLTKIKNFVKQNINWFVLGICVFILALNLRQCGAGAHKGPRKAPAEASQVAP